MSAARMREAVAYIAGRHPAFDKRPIVFGDAADLVRLRASDPNPFPRIRLFRWLP